MTDVADDTLHPESDESVLRPSLLPFLGNSRTTDDAAVTITVYVITGKHGWFTIPESFCRECHRLVRVAEGAASRVDGPVNIRVVSWYTRFLGALRYGGIHPPIMVVGNTRVAQGHYVPSVEEVVSAIDGAMP